MVDTESSEGLVSFEQCQAVLEENRRLRVQNLRLVSLFKEKLKGRDLERFLAGGAADTDAQTPQAILHIWIGDLGLSVRPFKSLARANILTVADLVELTPSELASVRNFGKKGYYEVLQKLEILGVKLAEADVLPKDFW
ncbi:MAG: DNA-directed RNA polymerase subunit alpha C-terminal domain-containing protein [Patescibacteria group bacterium]|jgi:DNA-directed RNA polymerase subunit alpha